MGSQAQAKPGACYEAASATCSLPFLWLTYDRETAVTSTRGSYLHPGCIQEEERVQGFSSEPRGILSERRGLAKDKMFQRICVMACSALPEFPPPY